MLDSSPMFSFLGGPSAHWVRNNVTRIPLLLNLTWSLFRDPRVPRPLKTMLLGVVVYVVSPLDFVPDFLPLVGRLDDLLILFAALEAFTRLAPPDVVADLERRYEQGHRPLQEDLASARKHLKTFWRWARLFIEHLGAQYQDRASDPSYVRRIEMKAFEKDGDTTASRVH